MIDGDPDSAMVVTREIIYKTKKDGSTVRQQVWVPLDAPNQNITTAVKNPREMPVFDNPQDMSTPYEETARTHTYRVSIHRKKVNVLFPTD